jgi:hypothetical protein
VLVVDFPTIKRNDAKDPLEGAINPISLYRDMDVNCDNLEGGDWGYVRRSYSVHAHYLLSASIGAFFAITIGCPFVCVMSVSVSLTSVQLY